MAKLIFFLAVQVLLVAAAVSSTGDDREHFARTIDRKLLGLHKKEKLTHFKVYWHDILSRPSSRVLRRCGSKGVGFLVAMNFAFKTGKYNGSTITILGRNTAMSENGDTTVSTVVKSLS
ncbi:hypothetical protein Bca52824_017110 [Brassica carinata]|uniref:Dirigent protein n=1 Tax=Brassica carinata TaxID=52824 RepID=A0A8X8AX29_BRACI|nr:hypothetical protein Bca52824_017110 [Brassica carinata]